MIEFENENDPLNRNANNENEIQSFIEFENENDPINPNANNENVLWISSIYLDLILCRSLI